MYIKKKKKNWGNMRGFHPWTKSVWPWLQNKLIPHDSKLFLFYFYFGEKRKYCIIELGGGATSVSVSQTKVLQSKKFLLFLINALSELVSSSSSSVPTVFSLSVRVSSPFQIRSLSLIFSIKSRSLTFLVGLIFSVW